MIELDIDARYRDRPQHHETDPPRSVFDDDLVVYAQISGPRLPITSAAGLSRQLRRALMSTADQPVAEVLSGHAGDGSPSQTPHLAIVPLPAVTGPAPDGGLLGIALVLPRSATSEARRAVTRAAARLEQHRWASSEGLVRAVTLLLGDSGELVLGRLAWDELPGVTLRPRTWTRAATRWASATPVALDRNPGDLHAAAPGTRAAALEAARSSIVESVRRIGLPAPIEVDVARSCVLPGTASPCAYPRGASGARKLQRVLVHVRLRFAERVRGPMLLGAGRYQGLGLCVPVDQHGLPAAALAEPRRANP
jgi:CRISPR-associated protein Csb2